MENNSKKESENIRTKPKAIDRQLQIAMMKFFLKTSIPKILKNKDLKQS